MSVCTELEVEGLPLEVVIVLDVNGTVKKRLCDVHEEDCWHHWEDQSDPVFGEPKVDLTITLKGMEWIPKSMSGRLGHEGNLLLPQAFDVLVDMANYLWLNLVSLNHLNNLLLLLVSIAVPPKPQNPKKVKIVKI